MATMQELEARLAALEAEVRQLRSHFAGPGPKRVSDLAGLYADDPVMAAAAEEADRLTRELCERERRKSLAAFDRAEAREKAKAEKKAQAEALKKVNTGAKKRPAGRSSRATA